MAPTATAAADERQGQRRQHPERARSRSTPKNPARHSHPIHQPPTAGRAPRCSASERAPPRPARPRSTAQFSPVAGPVGRSDPSQQRRPPSFAQQVHRRPSRATRRCRPRSTPVAASRYPFTAVGSQNAERVSRRRWWQKTPSRQQPGTVGCRSACRANSITAPGRGRTSRRSVGQRPPSSHSRSAGVSHRASLRPVRQQRTAR